MLGLGARTPENEGEAVRIGIVDSLLTPGSALANAYTIDTQENYIHSQDPDTTGHGEDILETLAYFAPKSTFDLYK